ncbi:soluble scavenger receptor cysteine-rich domain-containing protein SSC5D [Drosophila novamexicana]|uniref:soluble scavenger receptor cysteine-rich domain-containing protein SSC5D n=1 Tax=Drosophila novamexicana TaxID=47314 RepID=UPI0011E5D44C|nr:soluble scavenger receptor cysteine-rich domain-containing protein SSC5D [Drosophila novamexicana]
MHIKLLLISQLLALSCTQSWANDNAVHSDEETLDDVHLPHSTTTTLPELELDEKATARPDDGIKKLDESLAIINKGTALPETTIQPIESTSPTTTTTTTTTEPQKKAGLPPMHPLAYPHPYAHPYPYPYPYPYPHPEPKATSESSTKPEPGVPSYQGYPYPYPILRSPYSPYGAPVFHQPGRVPQYPGFARGLVYGNSDSDSAEKPAEADESPKSMEQSTEQGPKLPAEHPSYGYPPVYVIQRRPLVPSYPYASPARGYGSPYGYGG